MKKTGYTIRNKRIFYNIQTKLYEITDAGATYAMELEMVRQLKKTLGHDSGDSFATWYKSLSKFDKAKVIRTGNIEVQKDEIFYPDPESGD